MGREIFLPVDPRREDPSGFLPVQLNAEHLAGLFQLGDADGDILVWDDTLGQWVTGPLDAAAISPGAAGQFLRVNSGGTAVEWVTLLGEISHSEFTSDVSITATTEATANTIVTAPALASGGSEVYKLEFFSYRLQAPSNQELRIVLYDGSNSIGLWGQFGTTAGGTQGWGGTLMRRTSLSAGSHTLSVRGFVTSGTGTVHAGTGGSGNEMPGFLRISSIDY